MHSLRKLLWKHNQCFCVSLLARKHNAQKGTQEERQKRKGVKDRERKKGCCPNESSFCGARAGAKTSICLFAAHLSSESCARILWALKSHSDPLLSMVDGIWLPSQIVEECGDQSLFSLSGHLASLQSSKCCCSRREERVDNKRVSTLQNERQMTVITQLAISGPRFNICMTRPDQNRCNHGDQRDSSKEPIRKFV